MREVRYDFDTARLAALATEGAVKLLDVERGLRIVRTVGMLCALCMLRVIRVLWALRRPGRGGRVRAQLPATGVRHERCGRCAGLARAGGSCLRTLRCPHHRRP